MAPTLLSNSSLFLAEANSAEPVQIISKPGLIPEIPVVTRATSFPKYRWHIVWKNVVIFIYLHVAALYGIYYMFAEAKLVSILWGIFFAALSAVGVTAGAHRLWAHRAYKAKLPLRIFLALCQTAALQNHLYEWVRDHRVHHKFTDTDADPHNSNRGFFFSHMGWLLLKKHKDVFSKGKTVDMSDMLADPVVVFQKKYYMILTPIMCFLLPAFIPWYFWNEQLTVCWYSVAILRYVISLHFTWLVNSAAHIWGMKPYDKHMNASDNITVSILSLGEGWHNYHHVFPWDYKAAELGDRVNLSCRFIHGMAKLGQAYDLKTVSLDMVRKRAKRTGDGSRDFDGEVEMIDEHTGEHIWGWGDKDMKQDDMDMVELRHPKNI